MTLQDLKYRVLLRLGVVAAGDPVNPDDGATVEQRYRALHSMLSAQRLTDWNISDEVPDEFEGPICDMTAAESVGHFSHPDPASVIALGKFGLPNLSPAERQLRRLMSRTYVSKTARTEYF
jgi:hypothetical protein